jgi:hypothetical protein
MDDFDKSAINSIGFMLGVMVLVLASLRYLAYVGSPEDLYFGTLNRVMDCRRAQSVSRTASPEILDQICGKIPNISEFVKETK